MTKRAVIFNASNWHGENIKIEGSGLVKDGQVVPDNTLILKPGESCSFGPLGYSSIKIIDECEKSIAPFRHNGRQVIPEERSAWIKESEDGRSWREMEAEDVLQIKPDENRTVVTT